MPEKFIGYDEDGNRVTEDENGRRFHYVKTKGLL